MVVNFINPTPDTWNLVTNIGCTTGTSLAMSDIGSRLLLTVHGLRLTVHDIRILVTCYLFRKSVNQIGLVK